MLTRATLANKHAPNEIEILEGTFNYFKIEMKGYMQPCKVYFKYLKTVDGNAMGDLKVY